MVKRTSQEQDEAALNRCLNEKRDGAGMSCADRGHTDCSHARRASNLKPVMAAKPHFHVDERGVLVRCYHGVTSLATDWRFWAGITLSFPLEHWLWEKCWPFYVLTNWLGL